MIIDRGLTVIVFVYVVHVVAVGGRFCFGDHWFIVEFQFLNLEQGVKVQEDRDHEPSDSRGSISLGVQYGNVELGNYSQ